MFIHRIRLALTTFGIVIRIVYLALLIYRYSRCNTAILTLLSTLNKALDCIVIHNYITLDNKQICTILNSPLLRHL